MSYKNIMLAIDESNTSQLALQEAIKLAKNLNAKLNIIHVIDETALNQVDEFLEFDSLWNAYREAGKELLERIDNQLKSSGLTFTSRLIELKPLGGRLAEKIVSVAQALPADMLIIGTHGRRGFSRFFLGSVAENIVRIATCPVLLVRELEEKSS
jgi:nucleotide-binding universal stress UspA family protein